MHHKHAVPTEASRGAKDLPEAVSVESHYVGLGTEHRPSAISSVLNGQLINTFLVCHF